MSKQGGDPLSKYKSHLLLLAVAMIWSGNFIFGKIMIEELPPWTISTWRWFLATLIMLPLAYYWEREKLWQGFKHWKKLLLMGITGVFAFNTLVYMSLQYTSPVNSALMGTTTPVVLAILGYFVLKEKITTRQSFGMVVSMIGVLWVISQGSLEKLLEVNFNPGDLIMLCNILIWGIYSMVGRILMKEISSVIATALSCLFGLLMLIPMSMWELWNNPIVTVSWPALIGVMYVGIFASVVAFFWWNQGLKSLGPAKAGVFLNLVPVFAALFGYLFLGQGITMAQIVGGNLVFLGVYLTSSRSKELQKKVQTA